MLKFVTYSIILFKGKQCNQPKILKKEKIQKMDFVLWESKAGNNFSQNVSFPYLGSAGTIKMDNSNDLTISL